MGLLKVRLRVRIPLLYPTRPLETGCAVMRTSDPPGPDELHGKGVAGEQRVERVDEWTVYYQPIWTNNNLEGYHKWLNKKA